MELFGIKLKFFSIIILAISLSAAFFFRIHQLNDIPGLEHDEALICNSARDISAGRHHPLTGDKVYEGPLLEYVIATSMKVFGPTKLTARYTMAGIGVISILVFFLAGYVIAGPYCASTAALISAFLPWNIAASRVIYACNLSQFFIPLWILFANLYYKKSRINFLYLCSLCVGLCSNGRLTAVIYMVPTIVLLCTRENKSRIFKTGLSLLMFLIPLLPLMIYNFLNHWPLLDVFLDSAQGHAAGNNMGSILLIYIARFPVFLIGLFQSFSGIMTWIDFPPSLPNFALVLSVIPGIGLYIILANKKPFSNLRMTLLLPFMLSIFVIPLITKHNLDSKGNFFYHPHYMDLLMPLLLLITAFTITYLKQTFKHRIGQISSNIFILLMLSLFCFSLYRSYQICKAHGGPGRWNNGIEMCAKYIQDNLNPEDIIITASWTFEEGYPQFIFYLPSYNVLPYIQNLYGIHEKNSTPIKATIVNLKTETETYPWETCLFQQEISDNLIFTLSSYKSPAVRLIGTIVTDGLAKYTVSLDTNFPNGQRVSEGTLTFPDNEIHSLIAINRQDFYDINPQILKLARTVTPRHRNEIITISQEFKGCEISCLMDTIDLTIYLIPMNSTWKVRLKGDKLDISGDLFGSVDIR